MRLNLCGDKRLRNTAPPCVLVLTNTSFFHFFILCRKGREPETGKRRGPVSNHTGRGTRDRREGGREPPLHSESSSRNDDPFLSLRRSVTTRHSALRGAGRLALPCLRIKTCKTAPRPDSKRRFPAAKPSRPTCQGPVCTSYQAPSYKPRTSCSG